MATPVFNPKSNIPAQGPTGTRDGGGIGIGDKDQNMKPNQPVLIDLVTSERLYLQTIPLELDYQTNNVWAVLQSPGKNIPFYQYTGAEDTLNFQISWYANSEDRLDVITKCKWLESLSKADGYNAKPHSVILIFGELFKEAQWIVYEAPYKLSLFNREFGMMPTLAIQSVTLKRVSTENINPTYSDYRKYGY